MAVARVATFPDKAERLDANSLKAMAHGAARNAGQRGSGEGPVGRSALDASLCIVLFHEKTRTVQIAIVGACAPLQYVEEVLPSLPNQVRRSMGWNHLMFQNHGA